jgi:hypothetical protein
VTKKKLNGGNVTGSFFAMEKTMTMAAQSESPDYTRDEAAPEPRDAAWRTRLFETLCAICMLVQPFIVVMQIFALAIIITRYGLLPTVLLDVTMSLPALAAGTAVGLLV